MNQISTALHVAGVKLPPINKRIWLWLQDHPGKTAIDIGKALNVPQGSVGSQLNNLKNRGMLSYVVDNSRPRRGASVHRYSTIGRTFELKPLPSYKLLKGTPPAPLQPTPAAVITPKAPPMPRALLSVLENYTLKELRVIRDGLNYLFEHV